MPGRLGAVYVDENGEKKTVIASSLGISRETLYQYLRKITKGQIAT